MRHTIFCKHYRSMHGHNTCKVGIAYDIFKGVLVEKCPCFKRDDTDYKPEVSCELAVFPTAAEQAAEEEEDNRRYEQICKARQAIVASLGGPWKRGTPGASGCIECPVCSTKESLSFSRAGVNGHIHAKCKTDGCVSWME